MDTTRVSIFISLKICITFSGLVIQAKLTLGFSASMNLEDISDDLVHAKFVQKVQKVGCGVILNNLLRLHVFSGQLSW